MKSLKYLCELLILLGLGGCVVGSGSQYLPASHFIYPNSNVVPIGRVTGEASSTNLLYPDMQSGAIEETAYQMALKEKGGDILIDVNQSYEIKMIPLFFVYLFTTKVTVDGTAAKMEIGKKNINH